MEILRKKTQENKLQHTHKQPENQTKHFYNKPGFYTGCSHWTLTTAWWGWVTVTTLQMRKVEAPAQGSPPQTTVSWSELLSEEVRSEPRTSASMYRVTSRIIVSAISPVCLAACDTWFFLILTLSQRSSVNYLRPCRNRPLYTQLLA